MPIDSIGGIAGVAMRRRIINTVILLFIFASVAGGASLVGLLIIFYNRGKVEPPWGHLLLFGFPGLLAYLVTRLFYRSRARTSRIAVDPHCPHCGFIIIDLTDGRCPSCANEVSGEMMAQGSPRATATKHRRRPRGLLPVVNVMAWLASIFLVGAICLSNYRALGLGGALILLVGVPPIIAACITAAAARMTRQRKVYDIPRCTSCGYVLIGAVSDRCPECGACIDDAQRLK